MELKYLVVGTGRCGTVFMARLLTSLGIPCGHESIFNWQGIEYAVKILSGEYMPCLSHASTVTWKDGECHDEVNWLEDMTSIQAESSYLSAPYLQHDFLQKVKIIHVVRDPVKVVHSFCHHINYFNTEPKTAWEDFIYNQLPELKTSMPRHDRACLYYIMWNEMIEKAKISFFHRIENGPKPVMDFLGQYSESPFSNTEVNTYKRWSKEHFNIHLIQSKEIRERFVNIGRKYGYKMGSVLMI